MTLAQWENIGQGMDVGGADKSPWRSGFTFRDAIIMLFVDTCLWGVMSAYFERVIGVGGVRERPWFFFLPR